MILLPITCPIHLGILQFSLRNDDSKLHEEAETIVWSFPVLVASWCWKTWFVILQAMILGFVLQQAIAEVFGGVSHSKSHAWEQSNINLCHSFCIEMVKVSCYHSILIEKCQKTLKWQSFDWWPSHHGGFNIKTLPIYGFRNHPRHWTRRLVLFGILSMRL